MSATGNLTNKRVRIDPDAKHQPVVTTPLQAAECHVIASLTANGSLQESQKTYYRELFSEFIQLRKALKHFEEQLAKLNEAGAMLRSAQFNFTLNPTARLLEDNKDGVATIQQASDASLLVMHDRFKDHVISLLKLERDCVKKAIQKLIARSVVAISTSIAIVDTTLADNQACDIYQFVLDSAATANNPHTLIPVLKYSEFADSNSLYDKIFALAREGANADELPATAYRHTADKNYAVTADSPAVKSLIQVIKLLFFESWETFLRRDKQLEDGKKMKSFIANIRAKKTTEDTALNITQLDLNDAATVQNIIDHRVNEQTKLLKKHVKQLQQRVAKNNTRGATQPHASAKKKKGSKQPQAPAGEADAAANDSSKNNNQSPNSTRKSGQRKKKSRNNSRR